MSEKKMKTTVPVVSVEELRELAYRGPGFGTHVKVARETLSALLDVTEAAYRANIDAPCEDCAGTDRAEDCSNSVLKEKLSRFNFWRSLYTSDPQGSLPTSSDVASSDDAAGGV